jgi:hypothetical protein
MDITYFVGYMDPVRGPLGFCNEFMGCSAHGVFPCLGLIVRVCKSINKEECIVEVEVLGAKC